jgi:hypothetical protein
MCEKYSRTIFSMVSNASATMLRCLSVAAVVNTMNMDFHPLCGVTGASGRQSVATPR